MTTRAPVEDKNHIIFHRLCIFVNTLNVPVCLSRIICSDLRKVYNMRKENAISMVQFLKHRQCSLLKIPFCPRHVSHFHLAQRWIHVNDRCKNFISFYNRSRIKLSSRGKDNMSQHFPNGNSFSFYFTIPRK